MTIFTSHGPRLAAPPVPYSMLVDPSAALMHAAWLDHMADLYPNEGEGLHADRLAYPALKLSRRALGARA